MSYGNVIMSSGWDTLPFLSHPDEIANFDFPQHAVALQRFRNKVITLLSTRYAVHIDVSMQKRRNPGRNLVAGAFELRLICIKP